LIYTKSIRLNLQAENAEKVIGRRIWCKLNSCNKLRRGRPRDAGTVAHHGPDRRCMERQAGKWLRRPSWRQGPTGHGQCQKRMRNDVQMAATATLAGSLAMLRREFGRIL
jgi:hypothetical protein